MQKQPTFGRFVLVAALAIWTLSEWYPPQGKNMVDEFDQTAQGNHDAIVAELKEASEKLREGDELTLETWMTAVGDVDLQEMFPAKLMASLKSWELRKRGPGGVLG